MAAPRSRQPPSASRSVLAVTRLCHQGHRARAPVVVAVVAATSGPVFAAASWRGVQCHCHYCRYYITTAGTTIAAALGFGSRIGSGLPTSDAGQGFYHDAGRRGEQAVSAVSDQGQSSQASAGVARLWRSMTTPRAQLGLSGCPWSSSSSSNTRRSPWPPPGVDRCSAVGTRGASADRPMLLEGKSWLDGDRQADFAALLPRDDKAVRNVGESGTNLAHYNRAAVSSMQQNNSGLLALLHVADCTRRHRLFGLPGASRKWRSSHCQQGNTAVTSYMLDRRPVARWCH